MVKWGGQVLRRVGFVGVEFDRVREWRRKMGIIYNRASRETR